MLAMKDGAMLLVDEISLADDSVLERLNSVLEPERTLLLAEKGGGTLDAREDVNILVAHHNFRIIGTMNPGGDFGKKEVCFCFAFYANYATKRIFPVIFFIFVHISFCVICVPFYLQK